MIGTILDFFFFLYFIFQIFSFLSEDFDFNYNFRDFPGVTTLIWTLGAVAVGEDQ